VLAGALLGSAIGWLAAPPGMESSAPGINAR
jgi:hypothetical protein